MGYRLETNINLHRNTEIKGGNLKQNEFVSENINLNLIRFALYIILI